MLNKMKSNKSQIWIETTIYTLIGLTIIAILLSVAMPQIQKIKDREVIKQTSSALEILNKEIQEIRHAGGNVRIIDFKVAKGRLEIDGEKNSIIYILDGTKLELSEPGVDIREGNIILRTESLGSKFNIILTISYDTSLNITNSLNENVRVINAGATPYKIKVENTDQNNVNQLTNIDFDLI